MMNYRLFAHGYQVSNCIAKNMGEAKQYFRRRFIGRHTIVVGSRHYDVTFGRKA